MTALSAGEANVPSGRAVRPSIPVPGCGPYGNQANACHPKIVVVRSVSIPAAEPSMIARANVTMVGTMRGARPNVLLSRMYTWRPVSAARKTPIAALMIALITRAQGW